MRLTCRNALCIRLPTPPTALETTMTRPHIDEALIAKILADCRAIEVDQHYFELAYRIFTYGIGLVALGGVVFAVVVR